MKRLWSVLAPARSQESAALLDHVEVHIITEGDSTIRNRYILEKQYFLTSSHEQTILYPRESKFTLTERDTIMDVFPPSEFLVTFESVYFSDKKQKCVIRRPNIDLNTYISRMEAFLESDESEKIIAEQVGDDFVDLRNYALYVYHKLVDQVPGIQIEARYRLIDLGTVHSVVLVAHV